MGVLYMMDGWMASHDNTIDNMAPNARTNEPGGWVSAYGRFDGSQNVRRWAWGTLVRLI